MKKKVVSITAEARFCPILYGDTLDWLELDCGHSVDRSGFFKWLSLSSGGSVSCPDCREQFPKNELLNVHYSNEQVLHVLEEDLDVSELFLELPDQFSIIYKDSILNQLDEDAQVREVVEKQLEAINGTLAEQEMLTLMGVSEHIFDHWVMQMINDFREDILKLCYENSKSLLLNHFKDNYGQTSEIYNTVELLQDVIQNRLQQILSIDILSRRLFDPIKLN